MGDLTKNLSRGEMGCHCGCGYDTIDFEVVGIIQDCCDSFAVAIGVDKVICNIHSAARCIPHNRSIGSTDESQHPKAKAIDFSIKNVSPLDIFTYLDRKYPDKFGFGLYQTFVHADSRSEKARW